MKKIGYILLLMLTLTLLLPLLSGCTGGVLLSEYHTFDGREWPADSVVVFAWDVTDSTAHYDMVMNMRHRTDYPFQNIWFFTALYKDSVLLQRDTLDYYLCDQRGRWLGNGFGAMREMPMLYKQNVRFAEPGTYRLEVRQGMREQVLQGVNDLGLNIDETR